MAFDLQVFKTRALSAIVFGAIILAAFFGGKLPFIIVFGIVCFIGATEYLKISEAICQRKPNDTLPMLYGLSAVLVFMYLAEAGGNFFLDTITQNRILYFGAAVAIALLIMAMAKNMQLNLRLLLGYAYVPLGFAALAQLYRMQHLLPLHLLVLIWINDTMQYVVGANFGKHKMAPIISPKKTWEGTIGGSLLCVIVAIVWGFFDKSSTMLQWILLGFAASVIGTLGDLLESMLKRKAGIKDSGNIMPGHGGVLDRFDSLLLAAPVAWVLLKAVASF
jgi:phosphatidate cytidylyltransferase